MDAPFYIGQEVVAIEDHPQLWFKKGDEFTVLGIKLCKCNCKAYLVDIGLEVMAPVTECGNSGRRYISDDYTLARRFAPKIELSETTYEQAINIVTRKQPVEIWK